MAIVLDLDGVVWRASEAIPGSAEAVAKLQEAGRSVWFLTNNSNAKAHDHVAKLRSMAIAADDASVLSSAQAAALLLEPGETALACAGPGVSEALEARGVKEVLAGPADAVVVGWHTNFDYDRLTRATQTVLAGARLIGTNDDPTYPIPGGVLPGGGALLAAVAYASGATPVVAGKPFPPTVDLVRRLVGGVDWVVGDRPSTDGLLARALGARFALVLSGVTPSAAGCDPTPDAVGADLEEVVGALVE